CVGSVAHPHYAPRHYTTLFRSRFRTAAENHESDLVERLVGKMSMGSSASLPRRTSVPSSSATAPIRRPQSRTSATVAIGYSSPQDRKSTRLNSSHVKISYADFC